MTLAVAIAGLVVAVSSLVWQAVSWSYTGARVRVRVSNGITAYGPEPVVVAIVEANNLGRSAVEITGWGLVLSGGGTFVMPRALPGNTATPSTLAGGHRASVLVPFGYLARPEVLTEDPIRVRGFVDLGTGKRVTSDRFPIHGDVVRTEANSSGLP